MALMQSKPLWWRTAVQHGLVDEVVALGGKDTTAAEAHEPGALLIGLSMLGAVVCLIPLGAFVLLALGERFVLGAGGMVTSVVALVAGGALLRRMPHVFWGCVALVLWGLGTGLLVFNIGNTLINTRAGVMLVCATVAALMMLGTWLAQTRWIAAIMGLVWAAAVYGLLSNGLSYVIWWGALSSAGLLMAAAWWLWLQNEPQRLAQSGNTDVLAQRMRWAVFRPLR